jgi:hypothetical protein
METEPGATPVAVPTLAGALLMVATFVFEELQNVEPVTSCVGPVRNPATAENGVVCPCRTEVVAGVTVIETMPLGATLSRAVAVRVPEAAVIVVVPTAWPVARPWLPAVLLMVATEAFEELHVTRPVASPVPPSSSMPLAANWKVLVGVLEAANGEIASDVR